MCSRVATLSSGPAPVPLAQVSNMVGFLPDCANILRLERQLSSTTGVWSSCLSGGCIHPEPPAIVLLKQLEQELVEVEADRDKMRASLSATASDAYEAGDAAEALRAELATVKAELTEVKRVSSAALELDAQNQNLATELETQRKEGELLRLENQRLQALMDNSQILDGAIAVLLGVIIAAIGPRLMPRRRRSDGWA